MKRVLWWTCRMLVLLSVIELLVSVLRPPFPSPAVRADVLDGLTVANAAAVCVLVGLLVEVWCAVRQGRDG